MNPIIYISLKMDNIPLSSPDRHDKEFCRQVAPFATQAEFHA